MTNDLTPKPQSDLALRQEIFSESYDKTSKDLGYSISFTQLQQIQNDPSLIPEQERDAVNRFNQTMHEYAVSWWTKHLEDTRRILGIVIESQERSALAWINFLSIDEVASVGLEIADSMPESGTKRQIQSFYRNHLPVLDRAGVPMQNVNRLMAETDKTLFETSRAISRIEKSDLTEQEKNGKIAQVVDDALTLSAADLKRKYLNGHIQVPLDEYRTKDGTNLLTFVCSDDDQTLEVRKHTDSIAVQYGNVLPILDEYKKERLDNDFLTDLRVVIGIAQSGESIMYSGRQKEIYDILVEYGVIERISE